MFLTDSPRSPIFFSACVLAETENWWRTTVQITFSRFPNSRLKHLSYSFKALLRTTMIAKKDQHISHHAANRYSASCALLYRRDQHFSTITEFVIGFCWVTSGNLTFIDVFCASRLLSDHAQVVKKMLEFNHFNIELPLCSVLSTIFNGL